MIQLALVVFGVSAVFLTQSANPAYRKWAPIIGLLGQPFWFIAAYPQPGMLFVVTLYTLVWMKGVWTHWFWKPYSPKPVKSCKVCSKAGK